MNYTTAIFLINKTTRAIGCQYEAPEDSPVTVFKTLDQTIGVGDYVIVQTDTRHGMTVCKVKIVDLDPDLETTAPMRWIVGRVDLATFKEIELSETAAISTIKKAEKEKKRSELRGSLMEFAGEGLKALPIYTNGNGTKG